MKKLTALFGAAVGAIALLFSSAGCSDGGDFTEKSWQSEEAIEQIVVDVADRALEIGASEDGYVRIDYFDGEKRKHHGQRSGRLGRFFHLLQNQERGQQSAGI